MKSFQFIVGIVFILAGCASSDYSYGIQHHQDEFDGFTIDRVSGNYLYDSAFNLKNSAWLNMQRFRAKDGSIRYDLIVEY